MEGGGDTGREKCKATAAPHEKMQAETLTQPAGTHLVSCALSMKVQAQYSIGRGGKRREMGRVHIPPPHTHTDRQTDRQRGEEDG